MAETTSATTMPPAIPLTSPPYPETATEIPSTTTTTTTATTSTTIPTINPSPPTYTTYYAPSTKSQPQPQDHPSQQPTNPDPNHTRPSPPPSLYAPSTASTLLPAYANPSSRLSPIYRSDAEYLNALRAWAKDKEYMEPVGRDGNSVALIGFYGGKTGEDYARQERPEFRFGRGSWRRKKGEEGAAVVRGGSGLGKVGEGEEADGEGEAEGEGVGGRGEVPLALRRVQTDSSVVSGGGDVAAEMGSGPDAGAGAAGRRRSSLGNWLRKKRAPSVGQQRP